MSHVQWNVPSALVISFRANVPSCLDKGEREEEEREREMRGGRGLGRIQSILHVTSLEHRPHNQCPTQPHPHFLSSQSVIKYLDEFLRILQVIDDTRRIPHSISHIKRPWVIHDGDRSIYVIIYLYVY